MRILLTGATGFIGSRLLKNLVAEGHEVTCLGRRPVGEGALVGEPDNWSAIVAGQNFDACVHLAWIAEPGVYLNSTENDRLATAGLHFAESLYASGLRRFIGIGSGVEYAPDLTVPCVENESPLEALSRYAAAKCKLHSELRGISGLSGGQLIWARLFYPYGIGEHPARTATTFLRALAVGTELKLKTPNSTKDFVSIRDIISALSLLVSHRKAEGTYNIASGVGTRIEDLALCAADLVGADHSKIRIDDEGTHDPYAYHVASIDRIQKLGWSPTTTLKDGMRELNEYIKNEDRN